MNFKENAKNKINKKAKKFVFKINSNKINELHVILKKTLKIIGAFAITLGNKKRRLLKLFSSRNGVGFARSQFGTILF